MANQTRAWPIWNTSREEIMPISAPMSTTKRTLEMWSFLSVLTTGAASSTSVSQRTSPVSTTTTEMYSRVQTTRVAMMPIGKSRWGFLHSSAAVDTESKPMYVKKTIEPPVRMPGQPLGANGCQFEVWIKRDANETNTRIAMIFISTITLLVSADSRMPRTRMTVRSITMMNAGQLKPKCQPGP